MQEEKEKEKRRRQMLSRASGVKENRSEPVAFTLQAGGDRLVVVMVSMVLLFQ